MASWKKNEILKNIFMIKLKNVWSIKADTIVGQGESITDNDGDIAFSRTEFIDYMKCEKIGDINIPIESIKGLFLNPSKDKIVKGFNKRWNPPLYKDIKFYSFDNKMWKVKFNIWYKKNVLNIFLHMLALGVGITALILG